MRQLLVCSNISVDSALLQQYIRIEGLLSIGTDRTRSHRHKHSITLFPQRIRRKRTVASSATTRKSSDTWRQSSSISESVTHGLMSSCSWCNVSWTPWTYSGLSDSRHLLAITNLKYRCLMWWLGELVADLTTKGDTEESQGDRILSPLLCSILSPSRS